MDEKFQDFRELSNLLIIIKQNIQENASSEHQTFKGKSITHWVNDPGKETALRTKKQSVSRKPLKSHQPYERWNRNQGAMIP